MSEAEVGLLEVEGQNRRCSACGNPMAKAKKIYRGKAVCTKCYARLFKQRPCSKCGKQMRAYVGLETPVCDACIRSTRTCLRCDKPTPRAGLMVGDRAVCPSCAPYFRKPGVCSRCGGKSARLSRVTGVSDELICDKCQRELTAATCRNCGKHRKVHSWNEEGRAICKSCAEQPGIVHSCPDCGSEVPGGGAAVCSDCSMRRTLRRKANALSIQYKNDRLKQLWMGFSEWLIAENYVSKALAKLPSYAVTLAKVGRELGDGEEPSNAHLASALSASDLQQSGLLACYLGSVGVLTSDNTERAGWSDAKRIAAAVVAVRREPWGCEIDKFAAYLAKPDRAISIRTQRLYVRSAVALMEFAEVDRVAKVTEEKLAAFVRRRPGHRASLSAWLRFLKETHNISLALPKKRLPKLRSMKSQVDEVGTLLTALGSTKSPRAQMAFLAKLLSLLYAMPLETVLRLSSGEIVDSEDGLAIKFGNNLLSLDSRLEPWVRWLLIENLAAGTGYVFAGRRPGDAWSVDGVAYHLNISLRGRISA